MERPMSPKTIAAATEQSATVLPHPALQRELQQRRNRDEENSRKPAVSVIQRWLDLSA